MSTSIDYANLRHHPLSEQIVQVMTDQIQVNDPLYFRVMVAYFFAMLSTAMRASVMTPEGKPIPTNVFALNLAPSGFGKSRAVGIMEDEVIDQFWNRFTEETFPLMAEDNLPKIANKRAVRKSTDPDDELNRVYTEFQKTGETEFCFDSGTDAAVKQLRHKLLMANAGSMNLQTDEIGNNLLKNTDMLDVFMELFDGKVKNKLTKNTSDNVRNETLKGITPTNMLLFGTPSKILNGAKEEEELMAMLATGYARRCFFGFIRHIETPDDLTEQVMLQRAQQANSNATLADISDKLMNLADLINAHKTILLPEESALLLFRYKLDCIRRAKAFKEHDEARKTELESRFFKALKLAGAYAFIDDSPEVTPTHLESAIKLAEESGQALAKLLTPEMPYEKLAKYIADVGQEVTHADLVTTLPYYPRAANQRSDMLTLAIAWGYKHNIIIKKAFQDGIEFLRGESLRETNLDEMVLSYSSDITENYQNEKAPWDQLHKLTQAPGMHWVNHHLKGGYRNEDNAEPGFNMVVFDVDGGTSLDMAKNLLKDFKYLIYTTKRHTPQENRFRIIFPISHELKLEANDFKEFYQNLLNWLPFEADAAVGQRARKWMSHNGHFEYNDGELLDVLPFIPKTSKNEERKKHLETQQQMDNLERWVINNTGDGNRNNMLLRFAMILVDANFTPDQIRGKVFDLNNKLPDKLDEYELLNTVMVSATKAYAKRQP